jgi:SAM-dependent methyltransferase
VSGFAPEWLALREPYDLQARSAVLADRFAQALGPAPRVADLGCGTGANLRYLAPRLAPGQRWLCVDRDRGLLALADEAHGRLRKAGWQGAARFEAHDLATGLEAVSAVGVTASALLDLTSAAWLARLARHCRQTALLFALSFDGRLAWDPMLAEDALIRDRFVAHQRTDKGFGPALGPDAAGHLAGLLEAQGHRVTTATSDWRLGPDDRQMLAAVLEGVIAAAAAIENDHALVEWAGLRQTQLARGTLGLVVGHVDLLALPAEG